MATFRVCPFFRALLQTGSVTYDFQDTILTSLADFRFETIYANLYGYVQAASPLIYTLLKM